MTTHPKFNFISALLFTVILSVGLTCSAEETVAQKTETIANQAVEGVKAGVNEVRDKVCELVDGKLKCAYKKIKRKITK